MSGPDPTLTKCQVSLAGPADAVAATGASGSVSVTAAPECAWAASSGVAWLSGLTPASGQGPSTVQFTATPNATPTAREGQITVNGVGVRVAQEPAPCQFAVAPPTVSVPPGGGGGALAVTTVAPCAWSAVSQTSWLAVTSPQENTGSGTVTFTAAANQDPTSARSGTITVAGYTIPIAQPAAGCAFTLTPASQAVAEGGGVGSVSLAAASGCSWGAAADVPWITITSGSQGSGGGTINFTVAPNSGAARTGRITAGGQFVSVVQDAVNVPSCTYVVAPATQSVAAGGGAGSPISVTTTSSCAWTATSQVTWIQVTAGGSSTGSATVLINVDANSGAARAGTLTVAGQTLAVNQSAATSSCAYVVAPATQSVGAGGGAGSPISVATTSSCAWTATSQVTWIQVTAGGSSTGSATVLINIDANSGTARSGVLTVAGQDITVNQSAGTSSCSYAVQPTMQNASALGGAGTPISVTTSAGCLWTAASHVPWMSVSGPTSGDGSGTVEISVDANGVTPRSGTLTVAGTTVTVAQQGIACSFTLSPNSQSVGSSAGNGSTISVAASAQACPWTAATTDPWITVSPPAGATGNGTVQWSFAANAGGQRTGAITIAGASFDVVQAGVSCSFSINPTRASFDEDSANGWVTVVASSSACQWAASTPAPWITVESGSSGSGTGLVTYSVMRNSSNRRRTGAITIAGLLFEIDQDRK